MSKIGTECQVCSYLDSWAHRKFESDVFSNKTNELYMIGNIIDKFCTHSLFLRIYLHLIIYLTMSGWKVGTLACLLSYR